MIVPTSTLQLLPSYETKKIVTRSSVRLSLAGYSLQKWKWIDSVDRIVPSSEPTTVNYSTCLSLPLLAVISPFDSSLINSHPGFIKLFVSDLFYYDTSSCCIRLHPLGSIANDRPNCRIIRTALRLTYSGALHFKAFFSTHLNNFPSTSTPLVLAAPVSLLPFVLSITTIPTSSSNINNLTFPKFYKRLCPYNASVSSNRYKLQPSNWRSFWALPIPLNTRTTWYRMLHLKIPSKVTLQRFLPSIFPSSLCNICEHADEDYQHFLFSCPYNYYVWETALAMHVSPFIDCSYSTFNALLHLSPNSPYRCSVFFHELTSFQVIAIIQQAIWRYHYKFIFEDINFSPTIILPYIRQSLRSFHNQVSYIRCDS